jgi:hypothetical protein
VLIGLLFVVVTLMHDKPRAYVLRGSSLYMGPIVFHMSLILMLSAAALSPGMIAAKYAAVAGAVATFGLVRSLIVMGSRLVDPAAGRGRLISPTPASLFIWPADQDRE